MKGEPEQPGISAVVPALNEAGTIEATLEAVGRLRGVGEIIVADGGSTDDTVARARRRGAHVVVLAPGRGRQLHAGAQAARGEVLFFVHADSCPPADAGEAILAALEDPGTVGGTFSLRFAGAFAAARGLTWVYHHLLPYLGLRYGDSGYFVRRAAYEAAGGFRAYPIFEDLDLKKRLRRQGRFVRLRQIMMTSSRRFEGRSFALVFARWMLMQVLYWVGVHPERIARIYRHVREPGGRVARRGLAGKEKEHGPVESVGSQ